MARITVEDCVDRVPNRFELVMYAAQRSRDLSDGSELTVAQDNDKRPVVALREIADDTIGVADLEEGLIAGMLRHREGEKDPAEEGEELGRRSWKVEDAPDEEDLDLASLLAEMAEQEETEAIPNREGN